MSSPAPRVKPSRSVARLHAACEQNDIATVKSLLRAKRGIANDLDAKHWTALHWAASNRHLELCKLLLKSGANPREVTRYAAP